MKEKIRFALKTLFAFSAFGVFAYLSVVLSTLTDIHIAPAGGLTGLLILAIGLLWDFAEMEEVEETEKGDETTTEKEAKPKMVSQLQMDESYLFLFM
jgi:hypothetical protein